MLFSPIFVMWPFVAPLVTLWYHGMLCMYTHAKTFLAASANPNRLSVNHHWLTESCPQ